ncbi:hypothetical protein C0J52_05112 [Blattella germanica]|nr:hypothetical protein C0J52_05112 [Blattella germanica]
MQVFYLKISHVYLGFIVKHIKISRLLWAGHIIRINEDNPVKKLTLLEPEGSRRVGRPKLR